MLNIKKNFGIRFFTMIMDEINLEFEKFPLRMVNKSLLDNGSIVPLIYFKIECLNQELYLGDIFYNRITGKYVILTPIKKDFPFLYAEKFSFKEFDLKDKEIHKSYLPNGHFKYKDYEEDVYVKHFVESYKDFNYIGNIIRDRHIMKDLLTNNELRFKKGIFHFLKKGTIETNISNIAKYYTIPRFAIAFFNEKLNDYRNFIYEEGKTSFKQIMDYIFKENEGEYINFELVFLTDENILYSRTFFENKKNIKNSIIVNYDILFDLHYFTFYNLEEIHLLITKSIIYKKLVEELGEPVHIMDKNLRSKILRIL